jgi:hypothetical protein
MPYINQPGGGGGGAISGVTVTGTAVADAVPVASSASAGAWALPHGHEFDYVQITAGVTLNATADGNSGGTAVIDGNAVTYDGATRVCIEFFAPRMFNNPATVAHNMYVNVYDGTNDLGRIFQMSGDVVAQSQSTGGYGCLFLTPTAAAHTYHIRGWKDAAGDSCQVLCGAGGASTLAPAFYRITKA